MLEPISPSHIPEKPQPPKEDQPLPKMQESGDSEGFRFVFYRRGKKKSQEKQSDETDDTSSSVLYNEEQAVNLNLSPEALAKIERQRRLKEKRKD